jgi:ribonuclease M5
MDKIKITQTIIVEGKYDRIKLKSLVDANIITTDGFRIYNDSGKRSLIKNIAEKTGIIILTDSDSAGGRIRNFIKSCVGDINDGEDKTIINAYIPKIPGKEKRKAGQPGSKENILGVEGTEKDLLIDILKKFCVDEINNVKNNKKITKLDFYGDKLCGHDDSVKKRKYLCDKLNIPQMSANALLEAVNILADYEEYRRIVDEYSSEN